MNRTHRLLAFPLIAVLVNGHLPGFAAHAAKPAATSVTHSATATRAVTLITGDRVIIGSDGSHSVRRGAGREHITLTTSRVNGRLRVVPSDAVPLLASGRLDPRLFDITGLLAAGNDDTRLDLRLVVTDPAGTLRSDAATGTITRRLPSMNAAVLRTPKSSLNQLWAGLTGNFGHDRGRVRTTGKVWLDATSRPMLAESVTRIGAPQAWRAGLTGTGVTVAVLDTGVDANHPDLAGRVAAQADFTPIVDGGMPTIGDDIGDDIGHGTHVASTIMGSGVANADRYRGVAPGVRLVSGKICEGGCYESTTIAAMEWAAREQHAKVVNISSGAPDTPGASPVEQALNTLTGEHGTLFVVAAGNDGSLGEGSVTDPGTADSALTVGAVDKNARLAAFSGQGPRGDDGALKPDLVAPGVDITAAFSSDVSGSGGRRYVTYSGTSMAAPHVAGSAAILAQQHPGWTPAMLKAALVGAAEPVSGAGVFQQGSGLVDIPGALAARVLAEPAGVNFGIQQWPHDDDRPSTRTVTYRNTYDQPLTIALSVGSADGQPATSAVFSVDRSQIVVPANGSAVVAVTADSRAASSDGALGAILLAQYGEQTVRTPLGLVREVETHTLTVKHITRAGAPAAFFTTQIAGLDTTTTKVEYGEGDTFTMRLPAGRYSLVSALPPDDNWSTLSAPAVNLTADRSVIMDARRAKPLAVRVPHADAAVTNATVTTAVRNAAGWQVFDVHGDGSMPTYLGRTGPSAPADRLATVVRTTHTDGTATSPYVYQMAFYARGQGFSGLARSVTSAQLATVRNTFGPGSVGSSLIYGAEPVVPGVELHPYAYPLPAPTAATAYFNTAGQISWNVRVVNEVSSQEQYAAGSLTAPTARFQAGGTYEADWNGPAFGPCFGFDGQWPRWGVSWSRDTLQVIVPLRCDRAGHAGDFDVTGSTTVTREGTLLREVLRPGRGTIPLAAEPGRYRIVVDAEHNPLFSMPARTTVAWTVNAPQVTGTDAVRLPLSLVRFKPPLGTTGEVPSGPAAVPLQVQTQPGAAAPASTQVSVEVSYDDGKTWQPVKVTGGDRPVAHLVHRTGGYVSLRARAIDTAGTVVEQTTIRAYRTAAS